MTLYWDTLQLESRHQNYIDMKTITFSLALSLGLAISAQAQLIITGVYDGSFSDPKGIEVYAASTGDYTGWEVEIQSNANTNWSSGYTFGGSLTAGDFVYLTSTASTLTDWGWGIGGANEKGEIISDSSFNQNGDDTFRIIDNTSTVIDMYGVDGTDGTGEDWEYTDSFVYRNNGVTASTTFDAGDWNIGDVNFLRSVDGGQEAFLTNTFGTYSSVVPEPSSYALLAGLLGLSFVALKRRRA